MAVTIRVSTLLSLRWWPVGCIENLKGPARLTIYDVRTKQVDVWVLKECCESGIDAGPLGKSLSAGLSWIHPRVLVLRVRILSGDLDEK